MTYQYRLGAHGEHCVDRGRQEFVRTETVACAATEADALMMVRELNSAVVSRDQDTACWFPIAGQWLQIGGAGLPMSGLFGSGKIQVRVCHGGEAWGWRTLSQREMSRILELVNAALRDEKGVLL